MAHIVILGAGLGGMPMAYEMKEQLRPGDTVTVVGNGPNFHFVPSNPWVAVNWRKRKRHRISGGDLPREEGYRVQSRGCEARASRNGIRSSSATARRSTTTYLIIATGPKLAFDEIEGLGPERHTQSVCNVDHAERAAAAWDAFVKEPGPIVVGAVQGASCFGPAYEFAFIMETDLRRRKRPRPRADDARHRRTLHRPSRTRRRRRLEDDARVGAARASTSSGSATPRSTKVEAGKMHVTEHDEDGKPKKEHTLPFKYSMMLPAFKGIDAVFGIEGLTNPRGMIAIDANQRNPKYRNIYAVGVCVAIPPVEATPVPTGAPKTGYMIESMVTATAHNIRAELDGKAPVGEGDVERHLPRRHGRHRHRVRRAAADPAAQRQLVLRRQVGAPGQDRVREVLHPQDEEGDVGAVLREVRDERARHRQAQEVTGARA